MTTKAWKGCFDSFDKYFLMLFILENLLKNMLLYFFIFLNKNLHMCYIITCG